jgi:hypothetical protein
MRNFDKLLMRIIIFFTSILLFLSCTKEDDGLLKGTWTDKDAALPNGYYVHELKFFNDSAFISKISSYGIYIEQGPNDLTAWFEHSGYYSQNGNKLYFISHEYTFLDTFYGDQPQTQIKDEILFDNCTFNLSKDILELNYTTYPSDAPINTVRQYKRIK